MNFDQNIERAARKIIRHRWIIVFVCLLAAIGIGTGATRIQFQDDYRYFFSERNPQLVSFEKLQNIYNKNDNLMFVVAPISGDAFNRTTLAAIEWLTLEAEQLPASSRVDSLSNFQHTRAEGDDVMVDDLYYDAEERSDAEIAEVKRVAFAEPLLLNRLVTRKADVLGVNVTLEMPDNDPNAALAVMQKARAIRAEFLQKFPQHEVHISGMVPLSSAFAESAVYDMTHLVPLMYLAILLMTVVLLRSFGGSLATIAVILLSVITAMGMTGWLGIPMTPPASMAPVMISTLAVADSIHILVSLLHEMRHGRDKESAIVESLRLNFQPVLLTSVTTAIGFLSMNFSDAPPFHDLGNIVAMGVLAALLFSCLLLPALIAILPLRVRPAQANKERHTVSANFAEWVLRHRRALLFGGLLVVAGLTAMIPRNRLDDKFVEYFDESTEFRQASDFLMRNLTGIYTIEFNLESGDPGGINEPAHLQRLEAFATWWHEHEAVLHVNTYSDVMKRINRSMNGDDPSFYRVPDNRQLAAQYLLLYSNSLPRGFGLDNQINVDESATRFTVTLDNVSTSTLRALTAEGEQWLRANTPESMHSYGVSATVMFAHISERNIRSMLSGTTLALLLISAIMLLALRSIRLGLISLLPNLAPAAMAFGLWGLLVGEIGLALSVVTAMSLGIVVDDTVHFLSKYARARREKGLSPEDAVRYAFASVGRALVITSAILVIGFLILSLSTFEMNRGLGRLTAIVIVMALAADFLILPPLLLLLSGKKTQPTQPQESTP